MLIFRLQAEFVVNSIFAVEKETKMFNKMLTIAIAMVIVLTFISITTILGGIR